VGGLLTDLTGTLRLMVGGEKGKEFSKGAQGRGLGDQRQAPASTQTEGVF